MALGMGVFYLNHIAGTINEDHVSWKRMRVLPTAQIKAASNLFQNLEIDCSNPSDMNNIIKIQEKLTEYQIIVIDRRTHLKFYASSFMFRV